MHQPSQESCRQNINHPKSSKEMMESAYSALKYNTFLEHSNQNPLHATEEPFKVLATPIHKCPPELLSNIFDLFVEDDSYNTRHLLLISKQWYQIILNTPRLWTRINIFVVSSYRDGSLKFLNSYIDACLKRSGALILDIQANFSEVRDFDGWINSVDPEYCRELEEAADERGEDVDWDAEHVDPSEILDLFSPLIGPDGRLMERWGSLEITFPEYGCDDFARDLWDMLIGSTPHLTSLTILGFDSQRDLLYTDHANPQAFHDLSSLKRLQLSGVFEFPSLIPSKIEHLDISIDLGSDDWIMLSRFIALRTLDIQNRRDFDYGMQTEAMPLTIRMPFLQKISLSGSYPHVDVIEFDCPSLVHAGFTTWASQFTPIFPLFKPKVVKWELYDWSYGLEKGQVEMMLTCVLTRYPSMAELQIPTFMEREFLDLLEQLKSKSLAPSELKVVSFLALSGDIQRTIDLTTL